MIRKIYCLNFKKKKLRGLKVVLFERADLAFIIHHSLS